MENPLDICSQNLTLIAETIQKILNQIGEQPLARADRDSLVNFETNYKNFSNRVSKSSVDAEAAISSASGAAIHALVFANSLLKRNTFAAEVLATADILRSVAGNFKEFIDSSPEFSLPYMLTIKQVNQDGTMGDDRGISDYEKNIIEIQAKTRSEIETFERDIAKGIDDIEELKRKSFKYSQKSLEDISALNDNIEGLRSEISQLQERMNREIEKTEELTKAAEDRSNNAYTQIDGLLGLTASKLLLVDYAETAEAEKKSANILRNSSLGCMALTGVILCIALYESLSVGLDWKQVLFKLFTVAALSVPAAYLARESTKHRSQEHINRRISLDLRAITPYIATLPPEEQNKIKSEVASKIFGIQENQSGLPDNYPINIQELLKMLIDKFPAPK